MMERVFASFVQGGFECSTHRRRDGRRLDVIAASRHDELAREDYRQLLELGIGTVRDGFRWHLIETRTGRYDWSSVVGQIDAARDSGMQVIWDLLHYGWPDGIDIWAPAFVNRFAAFARAAAQLVRHATDDIPFYAPINEMSFFSWAAGDAGYLNPFSSRRGFELKAQLARAAIAAMNEIWSVDPRARFVHCDPAINVVADPLRPGDHAAAEGHRLAQYQGWDMVAGTLWPQLGGTLRHLDIVGVNYYPTNQWIHGGPPIDRGHALHRPLRDILAEVHRRYRRPVLIAETGTEGNERAEWFGQVSGEAAAAMASGVPIVGICQYPILNHPGWDDDRDCPNGLLEQNWTGSGRAVHWPLRDEMARRGRMFGSTVAAERRLVAGGQSAGAGWLAAK
jgi:hypothetical protein